MCGRRNASAAKKRFDFSLRYTNVADKISSPSEKDTTPQSYIFVVRKLGNVGEKKTRFRYEFPLLPPFRGGGEGDRAITISKGAWHATYCDLRDTQSRQSPGGVGGREKSVERKIKRLDAIVADNNPAMRERFRFTDFGQKSVIMDPTRRQIERISRTRLFDYLYTYH